MPEINKESKIEELIEAEKVANGKLVSLLNLSLSMRMFLTGITIGIVGNLLASYIVEFNLILAGDDPFWAIIVGIVAFAGLLAYFERMFEKRLQPIQVSISELMLAKEILEQERLKLNAEKNA